MIIFTIMGAPRGWARTGQRGAVRFVDKATASYENKVSHLAGLEMKGAAPWEGPVSVQIEITYDVPESWSKKRRAAAPGSPAPKKPDIDNCAKIILDGLNGVAFKDDAQVTDIRVTKRYGETARTNVMVSKMEILS